MELSPDALDLREAQYEAADATRNREGAFVILVTVKEMYEGLVHAGIEKFAKIAKRHKQVLEVVHTKRWDHIGKPVHGVPSLIPMVRLAIQIPAFVGIKGRIIGHFERAEEGNEFYTHIFDDNLRAEVEAYRGTLGICEHCNKKRNRKNLFVCDTDDHGIRIVGQDCLKDYLGIDPLWAMEALKFVRFAEASDSDWEDRWGSSGDRTHSTDYLVRQCFRVAKMFGGYNRAVSDDMKGHLSLLLFGNRSTDDKARRENAEILVKYNDHMGAWTFNPEFDAYAFADYVEAMTGDFGQNVRIACSQNYVKYDRTNIVLAGVGMYVGKLAYAKKASELAAELPAAKLVDAEPGKRVDLCGTVIRTTPYQSDFGGGLVIVVRCDGGENLLHFYSGQDKIEAGKRYAIRATVKKHGVDKRSQEPQTVINRAVYTEPKQEKML